LSSTTSESIFIPIPLAVESCVNFNTPSVVVLSVAAASNTYCPLAPNVPVSPVSIRNPAAVELANATVPVVSGKVIVLSELVGFVIAKVVS